MRGEEVELRQRILVNRDGGERVALIPIEGDQGTSGNVARPTFINGDVNAFVRNFFKLAPGLIGTATPPGYVGFYTNSVYTPLIIHDYLIGNRFDESFRRFSGRILRHLDGHLLGCSFRCDGHYCFLRRGEGFVLGCSYREMGGLLADRAPGLAGRDVPTFSIGRDCDLLAPPLSRKVDGCVGYLQGDCFISIPVSPSTGDLFLTAA